MNTFLNFAANNLLLPVIMFVVLFSLPTVFKMMDCAEERTTDFISNSPDRRIARRAKKIAAHADKFEKLPNYTAREAFLIRSGIASRKNAEIVSHVYMWNVLCQDGATYDDLNNRLSTYRNRTVSLKVMRDMVTGRELSAV